jgi:hypothetical protein
MTRTIRPIGPVTASLREQGYRQYAAIFIDGNQVENTSVLSIKLNNRVKFVGCYIDTNGEMHKTAALVDMKKAAARIMRVRADVLNGVTEPMIDCKACGKRHSDNTLCPED